jgi:hypothetical protein
MHPNKWAKVGTHRQQNPLLATKQNVVAIFGPFDAILAPSACASGAKKWVRATNRTLNPSRGVCTHEVLLRVNVFSIQHKIFVH